MKAQNRMSLDEMRAMEVRKAKQRKRPTHHEDRIQEQCVDWFNRQCPGISKLLHHSPNGGARSKVEGGTFKAMGTRAGFPDLILLLPNGKYHYLAIELKTMEKGSKQRPEQKEFEKLMNANGGCYRVVRSRDEFIEVVTAYMCNDNIPNREDEREKAKNNVHKVRRPSDKGKL